MNPTVMGLESLINENPTQEFFVVGACYTEFGDPLYRIFRYDSAIMPCSIKKVMEIAKRGTTPRSSEELAAILRNTYYENLARWHDYNLDSFRRRDWIS